jgi:hypothetical protein
MNRLKKLFYQIVLTFLVCSWVIYSTPVFAEIIDTQEKGEACFKEVRNVLSKLGISVNRNILLKMRTKQEVQVHFISTGGRSIQVGGYYQPFNPETIWIIINQQKVNTIADQAHELTHAWQSSNCPLQDRMLTEGFAMYCEYKFLQAIGEKAFAESLLRIKDPDYGDGLRLFVEVEKKNGVQGAIEYAKKTTKPPGK